MSLLPHAVLAAVDFSEPSRRALMFAAQLARQCNATLHVLHVEDPLLFAAAAEARVDLTAETRDELQRFITTAPPAAALEPCRDVVTGGAVQAILDLAQREGTDLIVLGAHGMSGAGRMMFGSVTEGVMLRANRSVLVVPENWANTGADNGMSGVGPLVVGIDFSESSLLAASAAAALAERLHTTVEAVHVVPQLPVPERWRAHADKAIADRVTLARHDLARAVDALAAAPITARVEHGPVAERLAEAAAQVGDRHPLLILGRRSSKAREGAPGATAYRVATLSRVPVLMYLTNTDR